MKDLKVYIIIASVLVILYLVIQYNRPKTIDWNQTLVNTDKIPFGTYILYNRIHDIFPDANVKRYREPVYNTLIDNANQKAAYIIITNKADLNEYDYGKLLNFIKGGNDVFIAAATFSSYLNKELKIETSSDIFDGRESPVRFVNKNLDTNKYYNVDKNVSDIYFSKVDSAKAIMLGKNAAQQYNFIKYNFGKGSLYLNANPLLFSNYSLLKSQGATYAAIALSNLKITDTILWDEYYTQGRTGEDSLMRVFLRNTELKSALYIAFFSLLIFVLYEMKRRQRIIPIIEPLNNTAVEFATVVGQVYYEQRNNLNIAQKKVTYFLEYVRGRYYLKTNQLSDEFTSLLAQKSGVEHSLVQKLVVQFIAIRDGQQINDRQLIDLNQNIEQFYTQSS